MEETTDPELMVRDEANGGSSCLKVRCQYWSLITDPEVMVRDEANGGGTCLLRQVSVGEDNY